MDLLEKQSYDARLKKQFQTKENHMLTIHQGFISDKCAAGQQGQWWDSYTGHAVQISSQSCDFPHNHMMPWCESLGVRCDIHT